MRGRKDDGKISHTNYSKKQNSKFPQSFLKISKELQSFYIYDLQIMEMNTKCSQKA